MSNIDKICLLEDAPMRTAIEIMNESGRQIILVVDKKKKLIGTFTDGDLRRSLLVSGTDLTAPLKNVCNHTPLMSLVSRGRLGAVEKMREFGVDQMPLVDEAGRVVSVETINPAQHGLKLENTAVIMAGGLGKRLHPVTESVPKALIPIGDRPVLELILERLIVQGFQNFVIAINHLGDMVEDYFGDGARWNTTISYLREKKRMGTAGGLSLLESTPDRPMLVMNCDVLTSTDFQDMLHFHEECHAALSMGVQEHYHKLPYGVVQTEGTLLKAIEEKPEIRNYISAGMYILSPDVLNFVPEDRFFDMTDLVDLLISKNLPVHCYPTKKYWIDIGYPEDLKRARAEYHLHF